MTEWRDIATAPKDGTDFLAYDPIAALPVAMRWQAYSQEDREEIGELGYWSYSEELLNEADPAGAQPTHWMPLPAPPENEDKK